MKLYALKNFLGIGVKWRKNRPISYALRSIYASEVSAQSNKIRAGFTMWLYFYSSVDWPNNLVT